MLPAHGQRLRGRGRNVAVRLLRRVDHLAGGLVRGETVVVLQPRRSWVLFVEDVDVNDDDDGTYDADDDGERSPSTRRRWSTWTCAGLRVPRS